MMGGEPYVGGKVADMEAFAAKLEAKKPNPGSVSMETSMMLTILADGNEEVLEKLRYSLLRSDLGGLVKTLEDAKIHDEDDLQFLRKSYEDDDKIAISHALRRLTGDRSAGTANDEFKAFDGKGFVRRDEDGQLERLPFIEEQMSANTIFDITCCWKSAKGHNTTHVVAPSIMPKQVKDTRTYTVMNNGEEWENEIDSIHSINIVEMNIANATGDMLTGIVNPNSGSLVMSAFDPTIPQDLDLNAGFGR